MQVLVSSEEINHIHSGWAGQMEYLATVSFFFFFQEK